MTLTSIEYIKFNAVTTTVLSAITYRKLSKMFNYKFVGVSLRVCVCARVVLLDDTSKEIKFI